jgi:beta-phosphoglucomutase
LIDALARRGWRQAIASSAPRANLDLILELTGVRAAFAAIVSAEDTTRGKPDPEVFQIAAARLQSPAERCVVFEDAVAGVAAACAAGMACVAVCAPGHHSAESLLAAGAARVVQSLTEISAEDVESLVVA